MYKKLIPAVLTLAVFVFAQAPMTNEDVIRMARQGVSNAAIVEAINTAKAQDFVARVNK